MYDVIRPVAVQHFITTPSTVICFSFTCTKVEHQQVFFLTAVNVSVLNTDHMFTLTENISCSLHVSHPVKCPSGWGLCN